jgi:hypothetical protein
MATGEHTNGSNRPADAAAKLRAATDLLEEIAANRGLLGALSVE